MSPQRKSALWNGLGLALLIAWFGLVNGRRVLAVLILAASIHEAGHLLALACFGAKITSVQISALGAEMRTDGSRLSYPQELLAVLAGPLANLLCAIALSLAGGGFELAAGAFWVLGAYNLLPIRPLDGGRAVELLVSWINGPEAGERAAAACGGVAALLLTALLGYLIWATHGNLWLVPVAVCAAGIGIREICEFK